MREIDENLNQLYPTIGFRNVFIVYETMCEKRLEKYSGLTCITHPFIG